MIDAGHDQVDRLLGDGRKMACGHWGEKIIDPREIDTEINHKNRERMQMSCEFSRGRD